MATKARSIRMTQTKQLLINAFIRLVNEKDFEKITIADLTNGAKVNRATFYAHFNDKYELLDYMIDQSASAVIENHTSGVVRFDKESIHQLVLAVCDYFEQPNIQCRNSYLSLIPLLKDKMLIELNKYMTKSLDNIYSDKEKDFYVPIYSNIILESGMLWASGKTSYDKETVAEKASLLVSGGNE